MENIDILHVGMPQFPYAPHGRMTDKHLVLIDTAVTFFTGLYLPTSLFWQVSTLYIIKTYIEDVFLGYELTLPFQ